MRLRISGFLVYGTCEKEMAIILTDYIRDIHTLHPSVPVSDILNYENY